MAVPDVVQAYLLNARDQSCAYLFIRWRLRLPCSQAINEPSDLRIKNNNRNTHNVDLYFSPLTLQKVYVRGCLGTIHALLLPFLSLPLPSPPLVNDVRLYRWALLKLWRQKKTREILRCYCDSCLQSWLAEYNCVCDDDGSIIVRLWRAAGPLRPRLTRTRYNIATAADSMWLSVARSQ